MEEDNINPDSDQSAAIEDMEKDSLTDEPVGEIVSFVKALIEKIKQIALKRPNIKNKENPKIIVQDLHDFFDQEAIRKHGKKLSLFDEKDYNIIKNSLIDDIEVQLKSDVTGQGWYDADVFKMFEQLQEKIPSL